MSYSNPCNQSIWHESINMLVKRFLNKRHHTLYSVVAMGLHNQCIIMEGVSYM
jgi:hypothetical protein